MKTSETLWHGLNSSSGDCSFSSSLSIFRIKPFKLHFFSKEGLLPPLLAFDIRRKMSKHLWAMSIDLVGHFCTKKVKNVCCVKIYCCKYLRTDYSRDNSIFNRVHTDKKTPTFYHFGLQILKMSISYLIRRKQVGNKGFQMGNDIYWGIINGQFRFKMFAEKN